MTARRWALCSILVSLCVFAVPGAHTTAQFFEAEQVVELKTQPQYPGPHSSVTVTLDAYTLNTAGATIVWTVDGVEQTSGRNERSITLETGDLGDSQKVSVRVSPQNSPTFTQTKIITASQVDLVLEADTYIPAFYRGRALPSGDSNVRAVAIVHSIPYISPESLTYEWKQGSRVLFGGPVRGKYAADIMMPRYDGEFLTVTVVNAAGKEVGGRTIILNPADPELHFYEENPLRGLSSKAVRNSVALSGDETTIHAEPYFMSGDLSTGEIDFRWKINGETASSREEDSHTITLRKVGFGGSAQVEATAVTTAAVPQYTGQHSFSIFF